MQLSYRSSLQLLLNKDNASLLIRCRTYDLYSSAMPNESAVRIMPTRKIV